jgi:hypothetical protein
MPSDIHLLPHPDCVQKSVLIGERRFLGLFCPDAPPRPETVSRRNHCRLCGWLNDTHEIRYRIKCNLHEDQVKNLVRHAQCPRCHHRVPREKLIEVLRLRGTRDAEQYTLPEFAALLKSTGWTGMHTEYSNRKPK